VAPDRFVTDTSLELLARRLRILGFDVETCPGARLEDLYERARRESRTVLTLSVRHPRRYADVPAIAVPRDDPMAAVRALASEHEAAGAPFSRCALCNLPLVSGSAAEAGGEVPEALRAADAPLRRCPGCGKWYWPGSHVDRLREWLERALGRPIPGPG
jgi:uncharacterized protein with PIN domain